MRQKKLINIIFESYDSEEFWIGEGGGGGAGVLIMAKDTGNWLILLRSSWVDQPGTWGLAGGAIDRQENPESAARREASEELGVSNISNLEKVYTFVSSGGSFKFYNFIGAVDEEFKPKMEDGESEDYKWVSYDSLLSQEKKHFGLEALIDNSGDSLERFAEKYQND